MAAHSSILAWRILWTEEPGALQSIGSQRIRNDLQTKPLPLWNTKLVFLPRICVSDLRPSNAYQTILSSFSSVVDASCKCVGLAESRKLFKVGCLRLHKSKRKKLTQNFPSKREHSFFTYFLGARPQKYVAMFLSFTIHYYTFIIHYQLSSVIC